MTTIQDIDFAELERLRSSGPLLLLDVRTDAEVAQGVISGARHISLQSLSSRVGELSPADTMVIYCRSGGRSAQACAWLAQQGFEKVYNLKGGMLAWLRDGRPVSDL